MRWHANGRMAYFYLPFLASDRAKDGLYEVLDELASALPLGVALLNYIS